MVGGSIVPKPATEEQGAVNGHIFVLDAEQQKKWAYYNGFMNFTGLGAPVKDYSKFFMPEGTAYAKTGIAGRAAAISGLSTPTKVPTQQMSDYWNITSRLKAMSKQKQLVTGTMKAREEAADYDALENTP